MRRAGATGHGRGRRRRISPATLPATLRPVSATASPALIALSMGELAGGGVAGGGGGGASTGFVRGRGFGGGFGFGAAFVRGLVAGLALGAGGEPAAPPAPPALLVLARLSLRTPGRERGRFPRTLSLSSLIESSSARWRRTKSARYSWRGRHGLPGSDRTNPFGGATIQLSVGYQLEARELRVNSGS